MSHKLTYLSKHTQYDSEKGEKSEYHRIGQVAMFSLLFVMSMKCIEYDEKDSDTFWLVFTEEIGLSKY